MTGTSTERSRLATCWSSGARTGAGVDEEDDDVGGVDGEGNLVLDMIGEFVDVFDAHSAGVDEFDEAFADFEGVDHTVAGDAGGGVDNGDAFADQPVEETGFADIGGDRR